MPRSLSRILASLLILVFLGGGISSAQSQPQRPVTPTPSTIVRVTDEWAVVLAPGSNPSSVAAELGFELLRSHVSLPNTFLLRRGGTERGGMFARSAAQALAASPRVVFFQQQVIRQHTPMNPTLEPQYANQWHLNNTGQFGGAVDQDSDVKEAWDLGYTGAGVQVAVVDSGVEYTHPDLAPNYTANGSWDYISNDSNPFPDSSDETHGQSVAGVIAAAVDGTCGVGAAYEAAFSSLRTDFLFDDFTGSILLSHERHLNDIYNNSWGWNPGITAGADVEPLLFAALANNAENGRGGLGNIYVFAAGNNGNGGPTGGGENANRQGYNASRYTISVAASTNTGVRSSYSEFGTPVHVNAPSNGGTASIYTTDRSGAAGYNGIPGSLDCTNAFGGTSSASPLVAGIVALMLDANPNLTWRDVQYILAESAEKNDPLNLDWETNGAGYDVSILYGFGRANAANAVAMAAGWANVPNETVITSSVQAVNVAIPTTSGSPLTRTITINDDIALEHVEVLVNITHPWPGDVVINLISPSGYTSQLMTQRNENGGDYIDFTMMSVHHWGESSKGDWTLSLYDGYPAEDNGTLDNWQLILYGLPLATNDKYQTPANITALPFNDSLHTAASTRDSATYTPSCGSGNYRSVWYSYTPSASQVVSLSTEGSNFDTVLSVWDGTTQVGCDNDGGSSGTSILDVVLRQGKNYRIMVSGDDGAHGSLSLNIDGVTLVDNLTVGPTNPLTIPPAFPTLNWQGTDLADEYQVFVWNSSHTTILNQSFVDPGTICTGTDCSISNGDYTSIPRWGLVNGSYEWWVGAKLNSTTIWSSKGTFSVNVPLPLVTGLSGDPQDGWPRITWDDDPNTLWVRLLIEGNNQKHDVWYERDGAGSSFTCAESVCEIAPAINWPGGSYTVSLLAWGPGGTTAV
jgi:subtilisin-like proprotein convertase family protein